MTDKDKNRKRSISLGFTKPRVLEGDTIYVDFEFNPALSQVSATAYSNQEFMYHTPALAGNILTLNERNATTHTGDVEHSWELDYNQFIQDLVDSNNGWVDSRRLIEDGSRLVRKILDARNQLEMEVSQQA
ncbi:hypothetical protein FJZ19_04435 [Candidatus Pacearchaeota archaeon]|nr:hypothetical protein [Candidatus Pacearchaeota archaeon]